MLVIYSSELRGNGAGYSSRLRKVMCRHRYNSLRIGKLQAVDFVTQIDIKCNTNDYQTAGYAQEMKKKKGEGEGVEGKKKGKRRKDEGERGERMRERREREGKG